MKCIKCDTEMVIGQAIKPAVEAGCRIAAFDHTIKPDELTIINCWKCPTCGHSEYIEPPKE